MHSMTINKKAIGEHFNALGWDEVEIRSFKDGKPPSVLHVKNKEDFIDNCVRLNTLGFDVYVGYNMRTPNGTKADDVIACRYLIVDLDHADTSDTETFEKGLKELDLKYNYKVQTSSKGFHYYIPIELIEGNTKIKEVLKKAKEIFTLHKKADQKIYDPSRILRVWGTLNHKKKRNKEVTTILEHNKDINVEDNYYTFLDYYEARNSNEILTDEEAPIEDDNIISNVNANKLIKFWKTHSKEGKYNKLLLAVMGQLRRSGHTFENCQNILKQMLKSIKHTNWYDKMEKEIMYVFWIDIKKKTPRPIKKIAVYKHLKEIFDKPHIIYKELMFSIKGKKKNFEKKIIGENYYFTIDNFGILVEEHIIRVTKNITYDFYQERLYFKDIKKIHSTTINPLENKIKEDSYNSFVNVNGERFFVKNGKELVYVCSKCTRGKKSPKRLDEVRVSQYLQQLKAVEKKATTCNCFYDGKYLDIDKEYDTVQVVEAKTTDGFKKEYHPAIPSELYEEFIKLIPDKDKITKCEEILNRLARNEGERKAIALIDFASTTAVLKMELRRHGITINPTVILIGEKSTTKSTKAKIFISKQWNTEDDLTQNYFLGQVGARMKQFDNNVFPKFFDEVTDLGKHTNSLKNATTSGVFKIVSGRKDGGINSFEKYFSMFFTSNHFTFYDPAEAQRFLIINYGFKGHIDVKQHELSYLYDNMKHIGKAKYLSFVDYDFEKIVKELLEKYNHIEDNRDKEKIVFIKIGEMVCKDMGLWEDIILTEKDILDNESSFVVDTKDIILEIIKKITQDFTVKHFKSERVFNLDRILNGDIFSSPTGLKTDIGDNAELNYDELKNTIISEAGKYGIKFNPAMDEAYLTKDMLSVINEELRKRKSGIQIKTLSQLLSFLELADTINIPKNIIASSGKTSTARAVTLLVSDTKITDEKGILP